MPVVDISVLLQTSETSDIDSKFKMIAICDNLENLSRIDHVVTLVKYDTNERTSRSKSNPPSLLNLKWIYFELD